VQSDISVQPRASGDPRGAAIITIPPADIQSWILQCPERSNRESVCLRPCVFDNVYVYINIYALSLTLYGGKSIISYRRWVRLLRHSVVSCLIRIRRCPGVTIVIMDCFQPYKSSLTHRDWLDSLIDHIDSINSLE
jgi:hypothetical protein